SHHQHAGGFESDASRRTHGVAIMPEDATPARARNACHACTTTSTPSCITVASGVIARGPSTCTLPLGERGAQRPQPAEPYITTSGQSMAPAMWAGPVSTEIMLWARAVKPVTRCSVGRIAATLTMRLPAGGAP